MATWHPKGVQYHPKAETRELKPALKTVGAVFGGG